MRKDVLRLAVKLSTASGMESLIIYDFLMDCGRSLKRNPVHDSWQAIPGTIRLASDPDNYQLSRFVPGPARVGGGEGADYWEGEILSRGEMYDGE